QLDEFGRPAFRYTLPGADVLDKLIPTAGQITASLSREIVINPSGDSGEGDLYFRAAVGNIQTNDDGEFILNQTVTLRVETNGAKPFVRNIQGVSELLVPIEDATEIRQQIVW
ncbi:MAG: hypothetical protein VXZ38_13740, partial [Planctomycetota bacterium]|nr:hypothetical protein [Planctomycetota bacterium]